MSRKWDLIAAKLEEQADTVEIPLINDTRT